MTSRTTAVDDAGRPDDAALTEPSTDREDHGCRPDARAPD